MLRTNDNWEKLVTSVVRRNELWELCYAPSESSRSSDFSCPSPLSAFDWEISAYNSLYDTIQDSIPRTRLKPEEIYVNEKPLDLRELDILQGCSTPPRRLKPGSYWYDRRAGFWGKVGRKSSQIITANLDVGGHLDRYASNGNSLVYINGREITKAEMCLLKCNRDTKFWMYEDGSYSVQGLSFIRGSIWGKARMRLLCSALPLAFPSRSSHASRGSSVRGYDADVKKIVLFGLSGSGKSTIFKQAKFLYEDRPFLEDERHAIAYVIRGSICRYIHLLLEARQQFEEESLTGLKRNQLSKNKQRLLGHIDLHDGESMYSISPRLQAFTNWLMCNLASHTLDLSSTFLIQHYAPVFEELWSEPSIQETIRRTNETEMLPFVATYFLNRAVDVFKPNYRPSDTDILYAEDYPSSLSYFNFSFAPQRDGLSCSHEVCEDEQDLFIVRSPAKGFRDNPEELQMFEDVRMVISCVPISDYDKFVASEKGYVNMMTFHKEQFESVVSHPSFHQTCVLLVLTKYDLFEEKIKQNPLNQCDWFVEFDPVSSRSASSESLGQMAFHYISVQFKRLFAAATGGKLYITKVNSLDQESVDGVLRYAQEVLKWKDEMADSGSTKKTCQLEENRRKKFLICM